MGVLTKFFHHQTLYWLSSDLHLMQRQMRVRLKLSGAAKKKLNARFLNVGCGPNPIASEDWVNIDGFDKRADLLCDAARKLPFANDRFDGVFAEHIFEHFTPRQARVFLSEAKRILRPGGVLRLIVPDGELYVRRFLEDRAWMLERRDRRFRTPMEVMNEVFRQEYEHQYTYDYETLALHLTEAGFTDPRRENLKTGAIPELLVDQEWRAFESLYVEARKPG